MECLVLPKDAPRNWVHPGEYEQQEKREAEKERKQKRTPNLTLLLLQVHKPSTDKAHLKCRHNHTDDDVDGESVDSDFIEGPNENADVVELNIRKSNRDNCEDKKQRTNDQIRLHMTHHAAMMFVAVVGVGVLFIECRCGVVGHGLQQVEDWKYEDPDKINQVPEEAGYFDAVAELLMVGVEEFCTALNRQPEVDEDKTSGEHVSTVETGDHEVTRKVGV
jgi:hypothetical protein